MVGDEPKNLAITILFGDRFIDDASPQLLGALHDSPEAVGELLAASWRSGDTINMGLEARAVG